VRATIRLGRIGGIELGLHFSWIVIALLITLSLQAQFRATHPEWGEATIWATAVITGLLFFATVFAHELSHAFVAKMRGLPIHRITLFLFGGMAQIEKEASDPSTEFWMGIAGPITSVVVGVICLGLAMATGWTPGQLPATPVMAVLVWLGYINLILAAFNMIPGFPLDGGRVLRAIIWWINHDARRSTMIAARVGQVVAGLFIAWGIFRYFNGEGFGGLWLALIGWFLMQAAGASYAQAQVSAAVNGLRAADLMSRECDIIDANMNLRDFVHLNLLRTGRRCFIVSDDNRIAGIVTPKDIRQVPQERWSELRVRDVMVPMQRIHAVRPETPIQEALEVMSREDVNQLPVVENGRLLGMLTRAHILQVLQSRRELNEQTRAAA
jgi:Zn-dependent protease/predicted transcriptional regulator